MGKRTLPGIIFSQYRIKDNRPVLKCEKELIFDSDVVRQRYLHLCRLFDVGAKRLSVTGLAEVFTIIDTRDFVCWKKQGMSCPECTSGNIVGPDHEGLFDCRDCGVWFPAWAGSR